MNAMNAPKSGWTVYTGMWEFHVGMGPIKTPEGKMASYQAVKVTDGADGGTAVASVTIEVDCGNKVSMSKFITVLYPDANRIFVDKAIDHLRAHKFTENIPENTGK